MHIRELRTAMRITMIVLLAGLLVVQPVGAQQPVMDNAMKQNIVALPAKAHVALHLTNGSTVRGRIDSRADQNFVLKPDNGGAPQTISYAQVRDVEQIKGEHSRKKWIIIGVVAGVVVVVAVIAVHIKNHPLGSLRI